MLKNIHPGEILLEEFLNEFGISQNRLGREVGMSPRAVNEIVHGKRSITANSALRLAKYFGTSPEFWLNLQTSYDLEEATKEIDLKNVKEFEAAWTIESAVVAMRPSRFVEQGFSSIRHVPKIWKGPEGPFQILAVVTVYC